MAVRYTTLSGEFSTVVRIDDVTSVITTVSMPGHINVKCVVAPPIEGKTTLQPQPQFRPGKRSDWMPGLIDRPYKDGSI